MARNYSLAFPRLALYTLLWAVAVVLLGLTSYRIHITKNQFQRYDRIVVELLVSAILTILWVPAVMIFAARSSARRHGSQVCFELLIIAILWVMWLVGAVDTTNRLIPGRNWCSNALGSKQCNILTTILAFAWIGWSLLTILFFMSIIDYVSGEPSSTSTAPVAGTNKERAMDSAPGTQQPVTSTQPATQPATQAV
ncbi:hypothetical protein ARMGADRAFT_622942 [Armillaria gallica]|uniref:MARVEL domain-containing protein n=1 Tax=Armillaria gallica TaxID=47427 RepID=A0A2H3D6K9_ARMGA|nr:hypothetical protein ARMGADRAFT_622942 [Armillaria gallica]